MSQVEVTRVIAAPPSEVWALVSDPTRYGEWSPENTGASWIDGATGPAVGARFKGSNSRGILSWSTICTVTRCDPEESFVFDVTYFRMPIATWGYHLTAVDEGTEVTETWVRTEPKVPAWVLDKAMRIPDRAELNRQQMAATLEAIADVAES